MAQSRGNAFPRPFLKGGTIGCKLHTSSLAMLFLTLAKGAKCIAEIVLGYGP